MTSLALVLAPAVASARSYRPPRPVAFHLRFRPAAQPGVLASGGSDAFFPNEMTNSDVGQIVNEQTSASITVPNLPGCQGPGAQTGATDELFTNRWLVGEYDCSSSVVFSLYSVPNGPWKALPVANICLGFTEPMSTCAPDAVGKHWVEFGASCYHCGIYYRYQNILTGAVAEASSTNRLPNLDAPSLITKICAPLRLPSLPANGFNDRSAVNAPLVFDGAYAVAYQQRGEFLEKCGTHIHQRLGTVIGLIRSRHYMLWASYPHGLAQLHGVFLPSRQEFAIKVPSSLSMDLTGLTATTRNIYVNAGGALPNHEFSPSEWTVPVPSQPKAHR